MKTSVYTYIMQNYLSEDIVGAFLEYNKDEDPEYLKEFVEQSTISEIVAEFVDNCIDNGESTIDVLNKYVDDHYITINPKIEKLCEKYIVLEKTYENDGYFYITQRSNFKTVNLCDCFDDYGQQIGCYRAKCYSFDNSDCDAEQDCLKELYEHFNIEYSDDDLLFNIEETISGENDLLKNIEKEKIKEFIDNWKEENEWHVEVEAWTYWDGRNYRTIILQSDFGIEDVREIDEEEQEAILTELPENPDIEKPVVQVETENYIFTFSRYASDPFYCSVCEK